MNKYLIIVLLGMIFTASMIIIPAKGDIQKLAYKSEETRVKINEHIILGDDYLLTFQDQDIVDNKMVLLTLKRKTDILERFLVEEGKDFTYKETSGREEFPLIKGYVKKVWHNEIEIYVERFKYISTGNLKITGTTKASIFTENIKTFLEFDIGSIDKSSEGLKTVVLKNIVQREPSTGEIVFRSNEERINDGANLNLKQDFKIMASRIYPEEDKVIIMIKRGEYFPGQVLDTVTLFEESHYEYDGPIGMTNTVLRDIPIGVHRFVIKKVGYRTETLEIEIKPRMTVEKHINLEKLEKILEKENIKITEGNVFDLENGFALAISKVDEDKNTAKISIIRNEEILLTKNIKTGNELIYENIISVKLNNAYTASINNRLKEVGIVSIVQYSTSPKKPPVTPTITPTTIHKPPSINLHGEKTDVVLGEEIVLSLSVINPITNPTMTAQVIIIPPSGMSVTSSEFAKISAGQYSTTYKLKPGKGRNIEVRIKPNQVGKFEVKGRIVYYFGTNKTPSGEIEEKRYINVRPTQTQTVPPPIHTLPLPTPQKTPGFTALMAFIILTLLILFKKL